MNRSRHSSRSQTVSPAQPAVFRKFSLVIGRKKLNIRLVAVSPCLQQQQQPGELLPFQCHLCTAQFLKVAHWAWHCFISHYGERSGTAREQLLIRPTEEGAAQIVIDFCACPTCPARFGTESALRAHLKASLVICGLCGKHYCSETLFQAHRCPLF